MELFVIIIILAFIFEFMDSAAGMGFGTSLSPMLLIFGYHPLQIVPTILITEAITGFIDSYFDHELKNVDFTIRPMSDATNLALIIAFFGCIGIFLSIILGYFAIKFDTIIIKFYVAILVLMMGLFGMIRLKLTNKFKKTSQKPYMFIGFAAVAGVNKGIGGGGYGPVITMGEIFSGIYEKSATAIVSLSEALVSVVGALSFFFISNLGIAIDLILLPSLLTGAFFGALFTPYMVRIVPNKIWKYFIPTYALSIGIFSIFKLF